MSKLDELRHNLVLARGCGLERDRVAVRLSFAPDAVEAAVAVACALRFGGVHTLEVCDHGFDRCRKAVKVETVETRFRRGMHVRVVAGPQPLDEVQHVVVAPHPRREAPEVRQGGVRVGVARETHHVAIHPIRVGPIALDRNRGEAMLLDQTPGDAGALSVELVRSVRGLADEDEAPVTDEVEQRVVVVGLPGHRMCSTEDGLRCRIGRRRRHRTILPTRAPRSPGPEVPMTA